MSATGNRGFTLLELLVVLAILVLLAGAWPFAAPRVFPAQQLRNETQHLLAALRVTRTTARITGQPQRFDIVPSGTAYQTASEMHPLPHGAVAKLRNSAAEPAAIEFYPDGSSTGGVIDVVFPTRSDSVRVGRLTGRAESAE